FPIAMTGLVNATVPSVMIGAGAGADLRSYAGNASATVTLDPQLVARPTTPDLVATFSSRGPSIDLDLKPDLVAPGVDIFAVTQKFDPNGAEFDPTGFATLEGTSFSNALVGGAAALVMHRNPNMNVFQIKSALVNTANPNVLDGSSPAKPTAAGAGKLNAGAAIAPGATVDPVSGSFGLLTNRTAFPVNGEMARTNVGSGPGPFRLCVSRV